MTVTDANSFLLSTSTRAAKFDSIGVTVGGPILRDPELRQQNDFDSGKPKTWDDGSPAMQLVVSVQTDLRDPADPEDDGERTFYIRANLQRAVANAVRAAGAKGLEVGGVLTVTYSGDGEAKKRGFSAPKLYTATYTPPTAAQQAAFLNQTPTAEAAVAAPAAAGNGAGIDLSKLTPEALAVLQQLQGNK